MKNEKTIPNHILELIGKALGGKLSVDEKKHLDAWYDDQESQDAVVYTKLSKKEFREQIYSKVVEKLNDSHFSKQNKKMLWLKVAAVFLVMVVLTAIALNMLHDNNAPSFIEYQASNGERKKIVLPDGSEITLNGGSKVLVNSEYTEERLVLLEGEAFFEVNRNESSPFTVRSSKLTTTVLGTSFNINSSLINETVSVKFGKVKVSFNDSSQESILEKGEQVQTSQQSFLAQPIPDNDQTFGWLEGKLVLQDATLEELAKKLETWYGATIEFKSKTNPKCLLTGTYTNLTLEEIMEIIKYSTKINYSIDGKNITIISASC